MMTVGELKEILEELDLDDDAEIRIAYQPNYPIEATCAGAVTLSEVRQRAHAAQDEEEDPDGAELPEGTPDHLIIFTGGDIGYGSRYVFTE